MALVNQNHTYQDITLDLGETWTIQGTLNRDNSPLPIDSNTLVHFKVASQKAKILDLTLTNDIAILDQPTAAYRIVIPVSQQVSTTALVPGIYNYELSATLGDGTVVLQAEGKAYVNSTLTYKFG